MKTPTLLCLTAFTTLPLVPAQDVSIHSFLENRASVDIKADNLPAAVGQLISQVRQSIPEAIHYKFVFSGTHHKTPPEEYPLVMKDTKIRKLLRYLCDQYGHDIRYDLVNGTIIFTAVTESGADPQRKYRFPEDISKAMALDWSNAGKLQESLFEQKIVLDFSDINLAERTVTASGSLRELDFLDMVIAVHGTEPRPGTDPGQATSEQAIRDSFAGQSGAVRIIHSADEKHLAAAHDRASGVIMEDIHLYSRKGDGWTLLGTVHASTRAAASISAKDGAITILDSREKPITTFHPR